jgi:hypothetical protein
MKPSNQGKVLFSGSFCPIVRSQNQAGRALAGGNHPNQRLPEKLVVAKHGQALKAPIGHACWEIRVWWIEEGHKALTE